MSSPYRLPGQVEREPEPFDFRGLFAPLGAFLAFVLFVVVVALAPAEPYVCRTEVRWTTEHKTVPAWNGGIYDYTMTVSQSIEQVVVVCDGRPAATHDERPLLVDRRGATCR